jgi:hypothetical protein
VKRLPAEFRDLLDRLCGKLRRGDVKEDLGAGRAFSLTIWESMLGSETSKASSATIMAPALPPRPSFMPLT